jgi:tetratricopeptide (TPR) repeat protein
VDGVGLISRLVDKSLLVVVDEDDDVRYRLLEPVRQYAAEKLAAEGEAAEAVRRHHDHYLAVVGEWRTMVTAQFNWPLRLVASEQENLRAALEWAWREGDLAAAMSLITAQSMFWLWGGHYEGCDWTERVVAESKRLGVPIPWLVLAALGMLLLTFGRISPEAGETLMEESVRVAAEDDDPSALAFCRWNLGAFELMLGKLGAARSLIEEAAAEFERTGDPDGIGWCHQDLGWVAVAEGDFDRAQRHFERIIDFARQGRLWEWITPHVLAGAAPLIALSDPDRGRLLAEEGVRAARSLPARMILAMSLARAVEANVVVGDRDHAARTLVELLILLRDIQARRWMADALEIAAVVAFEDHAGEPSARLFGAATALRDALGETLGGVRVVAAEVRRCRAEAEALLGPTRFAEQLAHGRTASTDTAIAEALAGLSGGWSSWKGKEET